MSIFDRFKRSRTGLHEKFNEKMELLRDLLDALRRDVNSEMTKGEAQRSVSNETERAADRLIDLCEELLYEGSPDRGHLRRCGMDPEEVVRAHASAERVVVPDEMDPRLQTEITKCWLFALRPRIGQHLQTAITVKLLAITGRSGASRAARRAETEAALNRAETVFGQIGNKEGLAFVADQKERLNIQADVDVVGADDGDLVKVRCPCCGEVRTCKPSEEPTQIRGISIPGRLPYEGVMICAEGGQWRHFCCGVKAKWVPLEQSAKLDAMKAKGIVPPHAQILDARCPQPGCSGALYSFPKEFLHKLADLAQQMPGES